MIELVHIGHSAKSRGIGGKFKARIEEHFKPDTLNARALFINLRGSKVPFLIESSEDNGHFIFKVEEIDSPEEVSFLLNKDLYLEKKEVSESVLKLSDSSIHPFTGFMVLDQNDKKIGEIVELIQYPDQLLAKVYFESKEILLPIHEDLILDLNEATQIIKLEIIEGLLDL